MARVRWGFRDGRFFIMGTEYGLEYVDGKMKEVPLRPRPKETNEDHAIRHRMLAEDNALTAQEVEAKREAKNKINVETGEEPEDSDDENDPGTRAWMRAFETGKISYSDST